MKLAGNDVLIWVIIAVVIAISQGWKQLSQGGNTTVDDEPAPPPRPTRPSRTPVRAPTRPAVRPQTTAPPAAESPAWRVDQEKLEQYRRRLADRLVAKNKAPPPIVEVVRVPPPVAIAAPEPKPTVAPGAVPAPRRRSPWVEQLRDPRSVRQFIMAAEVLGPPKGG